MHDVAMAPPIPKHAAAPPIRRRGISSRGDHALTTHEIGQRPPASVQHALAGPGRPLDAATRLDMARRFGHDFGHVRVHSGPAAEESAREVVARAYTLGHDIVFGADQYAPTTSA